PWAVIAVIAIGVSWRLVACRVAVTTMSSLRVPSSEVSCADAAAPQARHARDAEASNTVFIVFILPQMTGVRARHAKRHRPFMAAIRSALRRCRRPAAGLSD